MNIISNTKDFILNFIGNFELYCFPYFYLFYYSKTSERCTKPLNRMKLLKALSWVRGNGLKISTCITYMYTSVIIKYNHKTMVVSFAHINKELQWKTLRGKKDKSKSWATWKMYPYILMYTWKLHAVHESTWCMEGRRFDSQLDLNFYFVAHWWLLQT